MPELDFQVVGVQAAAHGLTPLLNFQLKITTERETRSIQALILNAQIQIQTPQRGYSASEKEKLGDLFGPPERWGQTLRNRLWTNANTTVGAFDETTSVTLSIPCTYDLNLASTKYFYALESGEIPLLFLFSGSIFYTGPDGRLQVERVSWDKECVFRMSVEEWRALMDKHFPNSAWLYLRRDTFERLAAYKRRAGLADWDRVVEALLPADEKKDEVSPEPMSRAHALAEVTV
jgi:hypothetical protein